MKKPERQDLLNEIGRLHERIKQEEKLNFSRTAQITSLQTELDTRDKTCRELFSQLEEKEKQIEELETELRVKEDLFKIQGGLKSSDVKIANLPYLEESRPSIEWYEERYQSDCITINQLHTTIDVLTDKLARLRGQKGYD